MAAPPPVSRLVGSSLVMVVPGVLWNTDHFAAADGPAGPGTAVVALVKGPDGPAASKPGFNRWFWACAPGAAIKPKATNRAHAPKPVPRLRPRPLCLAPNAARM